MAKTVQTDFSGGLFEAVSPGDFTNRQLPIVRGFVLENEVSLRSQPVCQQVAAYRNLVALRVFRGRKRTWLLALDAAGGFWYAPAPSRTAADATVAAGDWSSVGGLGGTDADRRFLCEVPSGSDDTEYKGGWLIGSLTGTSPMAVVSEDGTGANLIVRDSWTANYPTNHKSGTEVIPDVNKMPRADLGVMWGDFLILARVRWYKDSASRSKALSVDTTKKYQNALWVSAVPEKKNFDDGGTYQEFRIDQWSPTDVVTGVVPAEATILNLLVIEAGLLVLHTHGVVLLRGNARAPKPEILTEVGGAKDTDTSQVRLAPWPSAGIAAFIDTRGNVWGTNGGQTQRLDLYTSLDPTASATGADSLAAVGPFLAVSRGLRMLVLRMFQSDGAWTELVHPGTEDKNPATQLCSDGDCLYFLVGGTVYRFVFDARTGRGHVAGFAVQLTVASPTFGSPDEQAKRGWFRAGFTATGLSADAQVVRFATNVGAALAPARSWSYDLFRKLTNRQQVVVPAGIGPAPEASVTLTFAGDVRLESLFVETYGSSKVR